MRILLAEDEALTAMSMKQELERRGYGVCEVVATGDDAVKSAEREPPDLMLIDVRLAGGLDGIDAARRIRTFCNPPVIFMTGYPDEEGMVRARDLGPLGYFVKPVTVDDMEPVIKSLLKITESD